MIFEHISIQNFLSIKKVELDLRDKGLILLNGINMDNPSLNNNGAGKSSILEAIVYTLYGRTLRGLKGDTVVNTQTGRNTRVMLDLIDDDGVSYRIARYRKHHVNKNKSMLYRNGVDITPKSEADFDECITQLLQADYVTFTSSLLYSGESFKFTTATDSEIKKIFDTMLGLEHLATCRDVTKHILNKVQNKLEKLELHKSINDSRITELKTELTSNEESQREWGIQQTSKIKRFVESQQSLHEKDKAIRDELVDLQSELDTLQSDISDMQEMLDNKQKSLNELTELKDELTELKGKIRETELAIKNCNFAIKNNKEYVAKRHKDLDDLEQKIKGLEDKVLVVQSQLGQPCPTCGKPLDGNAIEVAIQEYQSQIRQYQSQAQEIIEDTRLKMDQSVTLRDKIEKYNKMLIVLQEDVDSLEERLSKSKSIEESADKMKKRIDRAKDHKHNLETDIICKNNDLEHNQFLIRSLEKDLTEAQSTINPYDKLIQSVNEHIAELEKEIVVCEQDTQQLESKKECLEFWDRAYSNQGIKSFILDDITPFLNRRVNKYLSKLSSGQIEVVFSTRSTLKSGEEREKFSIDVVNHHGGTQYIANSGGEKKRIDLAINLALQDLVASRSSKKINVAIFDEVFDSLDENGVDGIVSLLHELSQSKSTILVVSHNEYLKSYFTNVLTVVKQYGFSTLQNRSTVISDE